MHTHLCHYLTNKKPLCYILILLQFLLGSNVLTYICKIVQYGRKTSVDAGFKVFRQ